MTKRGLIVILMALFVVASFGSAFAVQTGGMTSNNGLVGTQAPRLPQAATNGIGNDFANGFTTGLDVHVNPDGLGDVLIYNYFNAREGMGTYFSVVNTSDVSYIRARVRFHEGADITETSCDMGSWEILDFDICLTPDDVWTAWIVEGNGGVGTICSADTHTLIWDGVTSQTFVQAGNGGVNSGIGCVAFKTDAEGAQTGIDAHETLEGYWTIIGEATQWNAADTAPMTANTYTCDPNDSTDHGDVPNVLFGSAFIADLADPTNSPFYAYNATALADFESQAIAGQFGAGTEYPTLADGGDVLRGVNYILTKEHAYATYLLDGDWQTEYVLTFPTKRYSQQTYGCTSTVVPNNNPFYDDTVRITKWDLDENPELPTGCSFSPCKTNPEDHIPYELNVITVSKKNAAINRIMPSELNVAGIIVTPFDRGWIDINFNDSAAVAGNHRTVANESTFVNVDSSTFTTWGWPMLTLQLQNNKNYSAATPMQLLTNVEKVVNAAP